MRQILIVLSLLIALQSCKNSKRNEVEAIIKEWMGKEIQFPNDFQCNVSGKDTASVVCTGLTEAEYRILLYVDSTGCSSCRLKLFQWQQLIEEADSLFEGKLSFLLFFQPKNKKELSFLFMRDRLNYPVFIDMNNTVNQLNHFPEKTEYQCFLLDKNNKILMIGNPTLNPKIWELFKQTVSGQKQTATEVMPVTSVFVEQAEMEINGLQVGKKSAVRFKLKNIGNEPLAIARVDTSCGCTVPSWEKKPVEPGGETEIILEIHPEESGSFHKTVRVYCNVAKGMIPFTVKGMVN
jgi:hypothetical protein